MLWFFLEASPVVAAQGRSDANLSAAKRAIARDLANSFASREAALEAERAAAEDVTLRRLEAEQEARKAESRRRARAEADSRRSKRQLAVSEARIREKDSALQDADRVIARMKQERSERERLNEIRIAAYLSSATDLVAAASPEKLEWLRRYAAGERQEALPWIQEITRLENKARDEAESRIAAERSAKRRRMNADNLRAAGMLVLDAFGRDQIPVENAIAAWEEVLAAGAPARMDHQVLATLWAAAADDRRAADQLRLAVAIPPDPVLDRRFPLASFLETLVQEGPSGSFRAFAQLARTPPQPDAPSVGGPAVPVDPRLPKLLDAVAECNQSLVATQLWREQESMRELSTRMGGPDPFAPQAIPSKPQLTCVAASGTLIETLKDRQTALPVRETLVASLLTLTAGATAAEEIEIARTLLEGGLSQCDSASVHPASGFFTVGCVSLRLFAAEMSKSSAPVEAAARIEAAIKELDGLGPDRFPMLQTAWAVPFVYQQAAFLLEELGQIPSAVKAMDDAVAAGDRILAARFVRPQMRNQHLALVIERARLVARGRGASGQAAFAQAAEKVEALTRDYPNSRTACEVSDDLIESEMAWRAEAGVPDTLLRIRAMAPRLERCDALDAAIGRDDRHPISGLTVRQLMRLQFYYGLATERTTRGKDHPEALEALEELAGIYEGFSRNPNPLLAEYHASVRVALGNRYALLGDLHRAETNFRRAAAVAQEAEAPLASLWAWAGIGMVRFRSGDRQGSETAWIEKHRICARRLHWSSPSEPAATLEAETQRLGFEIGCLLVPPWEARAVTAFFEAAVAHDSAGRADRSQDPVRRDRRQEDLFYLGAALVANEDIEGAREAFESTLRLGSGQDSRIAPFAMLRLAELGGGPWWSRLNRWLKKAAAARKLSTRESALHERVRLELGAKGK